MIPSLSYIQNMNNNDNNDNDINCNVSNKKYHITNSIVMERSYLNEIGVEDCDICSICRNHIECDIIERDYNSNAYCSNCSEYVPFEIISEESSNSDDDDLD